VLDAVVDPHAAITAPSAPATPAPPAILRKRLRAASSRASSTAAPYAAGA
jgi:hypothetical protein